MDTNYIIKTKNLTKQYGSQKSVADLNIHVKRGRIYGLLGRNGAGKTTTMKMLLGLTKPTSGEVKIWGKSLQGNEKKLLPRIGSLIESPGFYPNLTGTENLRIFATLRGVPNNHAIKDALDLVGLPYKDKKLFSQYSLGMKQRLAIALAVMHDPELLILDEPINGLDPIGIAEVRSFIRELCDTRGKTILISSHILSEISLLADDIGIIDHGALLEEESLAELEQKSSKHIRFTLSDTAQAARILERNFHENHFSIQGWIAGISTHAYSHWKDLQEAYGEAYEMLGEETEFLGCSSKILSAIDYMKTNYSRAITLEDIAEYVGISRIYLSQIFKKETGINISDFLIQYRLKKAKKLLLTSNLKVYTIAEMCGFGSVQYFGQIFKKMTGFSPYQFKDNQLEQHHNIS